MKRINICLLALAHCLSLPAYAASSPTQQLHDAALLGNISHAREALKQGAMINDTKNGFLSGSPLCTATYYVRPTMVKYLLENKADPKLQNQLNYSALHILAAMNPKDYGMNMIMKIATMLIDAGIDVSLENRHGWTAEKRAQIYHDHFHYKNDRLINLLQKHTKKPQTTVV